MDIIPKPELEPQISLCKWNYGLLNYHKYHNVNGIIVSKSYKTINNVHYILQHRLLQFYNDFFEIIDFFDENLNYAEINRINIDEFNNFENLYINSNLHSWKLKTYMYKLKISNLDLNDFYFIIKVKYISNNNIPKCTIKFKM